MLNLGAKDAMRTIVFAILALVSLDCESLFISTASSFPSILKCHIFGLNRNTSIYSRYSSEGAIFSAFRFN
jgi:hypothetical protein